MSDYVESILVRRGMDQCNGVGSPIVPGHLLGTPDDLATADPSRSREFLSGVGEVLWLSQTVHFELAYVAGLLGRFAGKPTDECWRLLHHVHRYLRKSGHAALVYRRNESAVPLEGYSDADWAGCPATARSTGAFVFLLFGMLVSWESKRQPDVASSTLEAETVANFFAIYSGLNEIRWVRTALAFLGHVIPATTPIACDNLGAVQS